MAVWKRARGEDIHPRTPCEIAWAAPRERAAIEAWMVGKFAEARYSVAVSTGDGRARTAVFRRGSRLIGGKLVTTVEDALTGTVFCGREILDATNPGPAVDRPDGLWLRDPRQG